MFVNGSEPAAISLIAFGNQAVRRGNVWWPLNRKEQLADDDGKSESVILLAFAVGMTT
jgi:hypothetical protein